MFFSSQQVDFNTTFYSSPAVLVSFHHYYNRQANHLGVPQESNIITAWVEVRNSPLLSCMFSNNNVDIHVWIRELACSKSIRVTWLEESFISRLGHGKNCLKIWLFCRKLISYPWGFASKTWVEQELNTNLCLLATLWLEVTINDCLPSGTCKKSLPVIVNGRHMIEQKLYKMFRPAEWTFLEMTTPDSKHGI